MNICCCQCNRKLPLYQNSTNLHDYYYNYAVVQPDGSTQYPMRSCVNPSGPTPIAERSDYGCGCVDSPGCQHCGAWHYPFSAQTFDDKAPTTHTVNGCPTHGYRVVHANRIWNGRYGFTDDYVANPLIGTRWTAYAVVVSYTSVGAADTITQPEPRHYVYNSNSSAAADSAQYLSPGGVPVCHHGNANSSGHYSMSNTNPDGSVEGDNPAGILYVGQVEGCCTINADRGIVRCTVPVLKGGTYPEESVPSMETFIGTPEAFPGWLASFNLTYPDLNWDYHSAIFPSQNTGSITLTNTEIKISVKSKVEAFFHADDIPGMHFPVGTDTLEITFEGKATLSAPLTFAAVEADAKALLNNWNMAKDSLWDYGYKTGNCSIAPMVSRRETGGSPGYGYCTPPTSPDLIQQLARQLAFYDASVVGLPLSSMGFASAYYNPGWFDFNAVQYRYADGSLCYSFGQFMPSGVPSQATQFTTGATDTSDLAGFATFSRYKYTYVLQQYPPFVLGGGAFLGGSNGNQVWASKYCEIKEPLPSQNFWAPTSVQPNQAATDPRSWPAPAMRDLTVLDPLTCEPSATLRYNSYDSVAIAGRAAVTFQVDGYGYFDALGTAPQLRVGDAVDFIDANSHVIASNYGVQALVAGGFKFSGGIPTGATFMVSHGHAGDWQWFDITPKGDYVLAFWGMILTGSSSPGVYTYATTATAQQRNVKPNGKRLAVICICPPGSPELTDGWTNATVDFFTGYPTIQPWQSWRANPQQYMVDRFWQVMDNQTSVEDECLSADLALPLVEARLTAPVGAPMQFATASENRWWPMPSQAGWSIACSGVWSYGEKKQPFTATLGKVQTETPTGAGNNLGAGDTGGGL